MTVGRVFLTTRFLLTPRFASTAQVIASLSELKGSSVEEPSGIVILYRSIHRLLRVDPVPDNPSSRETNQADQRVQYSSGR